LHWHIRGRRGGKSAKYTHSGFPADRRASGSQPKGRMTRSSSNISDPNFTANRASDAANCRRGAFSRQGSPELGEFEDAVVLKTSATCRTILGSLPDGRVRGEERMLRTITSARLTAAAA